MTLPDLIVGAEKLGLNLNWEQVALFEKFRQLLLEWNKKLNLTAVTDPQQIEIKHFLDSLTCTLATGDLNGSSMIDVGTGAGFPGIPLKIAYPDLELVLLESIRKKAEFLQVVIEELNLKGVRVLNQRAEELGQDRQHREMFDWAVARAVSKLAILAEYLLPFCKVGGKMLAQKGENVQSEVEAARQGILLLGGRNPQVLPVQILNCERISTLIVVEKIFRTPEKFPRRPGMPAKRPL